MQFQVRTKTYDTLYFVEDYATVKSAIISGEISMNGIGAIEHGSHLSNCQKWRSLRPNEHLIRDLPDRAMTCLELKIDAPNYEAIKATVASFKVLPPRKRKAS